MDDTSIAKIQQCFYIDFSHLSMLDAESFIHKSGGEVFLVEQETQLNVFI